MCIEENYFEKFDEEDWVKFLNEKLSFPFKAKVSEFQEKGLLQQGDNITVYSIEGADDKYGVIILYKIGRKRYYFPLVDLEPITQDEECKKMIEDYKEWFGNRWY